MTGTSGRSPTIAATCLNADAFLVEEVQGKVRGSSPTGVNFTIRFYGTHAAANAAFARLKPRFAAMFATAVVDFAGNPPPAPGAAPRVLEHLDLITIRHCIVIRGAAPARG